MTVGTKIDLELVGEWKREVEQEIEEIVRKRFPNVRVFGYLMLQTMGMDACSTQTISRIETMNAKGIRESARLFVKHLEAQTTEKNDATSKRE